MRRIGPAALIACGVLLLIGAVGWWWLSARLANPDSVSVPDVIAGSPLSQKTVGVEAVAEVTRLHGKEFPLTSGAMATYGGNGEATLWVTGTPAGPMAAEMVRAMTDRIAEASASFGSAQDRGSARSPFTPIGVREVARREVYELAGMGQRHFYFRSGSLVIWLAADESIAEQAVEEALIFYP